ncbi:unnamed protein product [Paramecium octaurelia]|uniref:Uncharacterized protein n=1 Tax=Paramecium octaurelia TaxID=43137 RepID=A0A8S1XLJ0_PAROT|nr:unnamed protein product [Paramecium octaurelia]
MAGYSPKEESDLCGVIVKTNFFGTVLQSVLRIDKVLVYNFWDINQNKKFHHIKQNVIHQLISQQFFIIFINFNQLHPNPLRRRIGITRIGSRKRDFCLNVSNSLQHYQHVHLDCLRISYFKVTNLEKFTFIRQTKKLRILKRKLRKLMRSQISRRRGMNGQWQGGSLSGMTASNQSQYYPYQEGPSYGNSHQETDNSDVKSIPEPIIIPDISIISSSSTLHSSSQTRTADVNNVDVQKITDNNSNITKNNNNINTTNNQCEGIVKRAFQQYDPNEQCQWFQHQQQ